MPNKHILYIELKSGFGHNGPAWIAEVTYSKSGQTIYFDNKALKKLKIPGISCNHFDIETGEEYWVSGFKKNGQDRHIFGSGSVMIDQDIVNEYLANVDFNKLDDNHFQIIELDKQFDKTRFNQLENNPKTYNPEDYPEYQYWFWDRNKRKLILQ